MLLAIHNLKYKQLLSLTWTVTFEIFADLCIIFVSLFELYSVYLIFTQNGNAWLSFVNVCLLGLISILFVNICLTGWISVSDLPDSLVCNAAFLSMQDEHCMYMTELKCTLSCCLKKSKKYLYLQKNKTATTKTNNSHLHVISRHVHFYHWCFEFITTIIKNIIILEN